jgi:hypothetical protein
MTNTRTADDLSALEEHDDTSVPDDARRPIMTTTISIHADELRPGDLLDYGGRPRRITDVIRRSGFSWPVAVDGTGWAMALGQGPLTVWRR